MRFVAAAELIEHLSLDTLVVEELIAGSKSLLRAVETLPNIERSLATDVSSSAYVRFQIQVDTDDEDCATSSLVTFLKSATDNRGIPFEIIRVGFGSVVIEAATWFVVVMMLFSGSPFCKLYLRRDKIGHENA